jgi:hypothetical protein
MRQSKVLERERMGIVGKKCVDVKGQIDHHIQTE